MACTGRFAEAWQFSTFSCPSNILKGVDNGPGGGVPFLSDTTTDFVKRGVRGMVGMILYNLTTGTSGPVVTVTTNNMVATGVTWNIGNIYRLAILTGIEIASIETALEISASDLHAALARADACSCIFATWALGYLAKLNVIDAMVFYNCSCGGTSLTDEVKSTYMEWVTNQLELIGTGKFELCAGATGADFPSITWAEQSSTDFAAAEILVNRVP